MSSNNNISNPPQYHTLPPHLSVPPTSTVPPSHPPFHQSLAIKTKRPPPNPLPNPAKSSAKYHHLLPCLLSSPPLSDQPSINHPTNHIIMTSRDILGNKRFGRRDNRYQYVLDAAWALYMMSRRDEGEAKEQIEAQEREKREKQRKEGEEMNEMRDEGEGERKGAEGGGCAKGRGGGEDGGE
ncbi:hypothetical protein TI39_contig395g00015 [Zymoseptoria brevis]|uniref:Uncharacterized protein n=1 Tax=Zymoseptoria brevis TaxID=1047168 RepID=A0A0F4GMT6_9PEZI|nr:hypothetical protein TI39_contig395g00015 [Zymoseptoria brevis]